MAGLAKATTPAKHLAEPHPFYPATEQANDQAANDYLRRSLVMKINRRLALSTGLGTVLSAMTFSASRADEGLLSGALDGLEDFWLATDAYIFGYPLVTMEMTRRVMTNVAAPQGTRGPMGQFVKARQYPNASFRDVTAPNADTLYTSGWIDVGDRK